MANVTLQGIGKNILIHFTEVTDALQKLELSKQGRTNEDLPIPLDDIQSEEERFKLWAANLGLYATGDRSLDYRIQDSPSVKEYTNQLLDDLREDLVNGKPIKPVIIIGTCLTGCSIWCTE
jgi:hypothetical protein